MKLRLVDENGVEVAQPYEVRLPGWTEERYFAEAPEEAAAVASEPASQEKAPAATEPKPAGTTEDESTEPAEAEYTTASVHTAAEDDQEASGEGKGGAP